MRHSQNLIFIDMDLKDFNYNSEALDKVLQSTLQKIEKRLGGCPTVLWTGNGYRIYPPVDAFVFEEHKVFSAERIPYILRHSY